MLVKQFHYISKKNLKWFLSQSNIKHKVIVLLMLDAGLRISEACSINAKILILKSKYHIQSAKKRGQNTCELFQYQTDFTKLSRIKE
jgi:integrase